MKISPVIGAQDPYTKWACLLLFGMEYFSCGGKYRASGVVLVGRGTNYTCGGSSDVGIGRWIYCWWW